jgi:rubrerythrin
MRDIKDDIEIEEHHIHPKFMDNKKGYGKKYMLDKKEHIKLHLIIPSIIWKYIPNEQKNKCIKEVINFSELFINSEEMEKEEEKEMKEIIETEDIIICPNCSYINDIEDIYCNNCDKVIKNV